MSEGILQKIKMQAIFWLARRLPTCKEVAPWMSEVLDSDLPLARRIKLKLHILICVWCKRYQEQLFLLRETTQNLSKQVEAESVTTPALSADARQRMKALLKQTEK